MKGTVAILVPAYNPPASFYSLICDLRAANPQEPIVVVDDGSAPPLDATKLEGSDINLVRHAGNCGKGAALKTGFKHIKQMSSASPEHCHRGRGRPTSGGRRGEHGAFS